MKGILAINKKVKLIIAADIKELVIRQIKTTFCFHFVDGSATASVEVNYYSGPFTSLSAGIGKDIYEY